MKSKDQLCNFCGRKKAETLMLISGLDAQICENCIEQAHKILEEELGIEPSSNKSKNKLKNFDQQFELPKPKEIHAYLNNYIIGQNDAKKVLCVAVYNHYKRIMNQKKEDEVEIEKSNILLIGETGTGKTLLARTLARMLKVPFCIADATVLTEAGYVGDDVESILSRLLQVADYNPELAERGIIYLDEIDKISRKSDNPSITRDVSGEGVQQGLLKILEGTVAHVAPEGGRKHPDAKYVKIDTSNILFICGGAFAGIEKIVSRRLQTQGVGFKTNRTNKINDNEMLKHVTPADLKQFGLIPEILGRLPVISALETLDKAALKNILLEPKNALIKQYKKLFEMEGLELVIKEEVLDFIVHEAFENQLGARGLRGICEAILLEDMYDVSELAEKTNKKVIITLKTAEERWAKKKASIAA